MDPDKFQQAWQAQSFQTRVTVNADLLLKEVQRNQRDFRALILRRDVIEVGIALLLVPLWFYLGVKNSLPWTWYLTAPVLLWMAGFMIAYRLRHPQRPSDPEEPLLECVKNSLFHVEDQIWLLRNIFWWYLLPPTMSISAFFAHVSWLGALETSDWLAALVFAAGLFAFLGGLYSFIYYLNQRAVRVQLEPRREELLTLLASLGDESTSEYLEATRAPNLESSRKLRRWTIAGASCFVAFVVISLATGVFESRYDGRPRRSGPAGAALARVIVEQRHEKNLVAVAAMVTVDGRLEAAAAHGERKIGSGVPVELGDRWHVGGIAKGITATMIARLIEAGEMQWSDTVGAAFPEADVHDDWKPVTLRQILTDTAGAPRSFSLEVRFQRPALGLESTQARRQAVLDVVADKPAYPPGTEYEYSNVGYTIAAAMAEKATGATWEDLVQRHVFKPLGLTQSGFGPPKSGDETLEQPRGHWPRAGAKIPVGDDADNTFIMSPSGAVHMSLGDLCAYAEEHLRGDRGEGKLLSAATYQLLHTPERSYYACGWIKSQPGEHLPHLSYWHNGSNTMWYALVAFLPEKNMVVAVTSNDGDIENAEAAAWDVVQASVERYDVLAERPLDEEYPKKSPFAAVRWQQSQPEVQVGGEWFKLLSLDAAPAEEIVAFSQRTYGDKWQKRFEEDLVELLTRMGRAPQDKVTLTVQSLSSGETNVLKDIPMTQANRWQIKAAAQARENAKP